MFTQYFDVAQGFWFLAYRGPMTLRPGSYSVEGNCIVQERGGVGAQIDVDGVGTHRLFREGKFMTCIYSDDLSIIDERVRNQPPDKNELAA